jgi:photosystem II stability/assembly factor-like uncharacterized protein
MQKFLVLLISLFFSVLPHSLAQWEPMNEGLWGGDVSCIAFEDNDIFIGTNCGVFRSTDGGQSWIIANSSIESVFISSLVKSGDYLIASTYNRGIFRSSDKGVTWENLDNSLNDLYVESLVLADDKIFAITNSNGVLFSTDNATSWDEFESGFNSRDVVVLEYFENNIYIGTNDNGIFVSSDMGESWTSLGPENTHIYALAVNDSNIAIGINSGVGISLKSDTTKNWIMSTDSIIKSIGKVTFIDDNIFASGYTGIFRSSDNGLYWEKTSEGLTGNYSNFITSNGSIILAGSDYRGMIITADKGNTWIQNNNKYISNFIYSLAEHNGFLYAGTSRNGIFRSSNNGGTWSQLENLNKYQSVNNLIVHDNMLIAGCYHSKLFSSNNNGDDWTQIDDFGQVEFITSIDNNLFMTADFRFFKSTDKGVTWAKSDSGLPIPRVTALVMKDSCLYAGTFFDGLYKSTNSGEFWTASSNGLLDSSINAMVAVDDNIYAGTRNKGIFRSTDDGANWTEFNEGLTNSQIWGLASFESYIFAGTDNGFFIYNGNDNKWIELSTGLTCTRVVSFLVQNDYLLVGTLGGGIFRAKLSDLLKHVVSVDDEPERSPNEISIYPNPAGDIINIQTNTNGKQQIHIYNSIGVCVQSVQVNSQELSIDVSRLPACMYLIKSADKSKIFIKN